MSIPQLITAGVVAAEVGEPLHRVVRVLNTRAHIQPSARAGNLRLYQRATITLVREELQAIKAKRRVGGVA